MEKFCKMGKKWGRKRKLNQRLSQGKKWSRIHPWITFTEIRQDTRNASAVVYV